MKNFIKLGLVVSFFWLSTLNHSVFAIDCSSYPPGLPNGSTCSFTDCECASDVCVNGSCVDCASDSDCQGGQHCISNNCQ